MPRVTDAGIAFDHFNPQTLVSLCAVMGRNGFNHLMNTGHDAREIYLGGRCDEAVFLGMGNVMGALGGFDQCLRGDAAKIEAIPPHFSGLNQGDLGLDRSGDIGRNKTSCACANHDQIAIKTGRARIGAIGAIAFDARNRKFCNPWKKAKRCKRPDQRGRQNISNGCDRCQLRPCVHINGRSCKHPHLAYPVKG